MTVDSSLCPGCFLVERGDGTCEGCGFDPDVVEYTTVLRPDATLQDRYVVGRVLGEPGGFGVTYLAWDERLHRRIALKELMPRELVARDPDGSTLRPHSTSGQDLFTYTRESFLNEARMVARFKHPNLVKVLDYFEANNTAYFAMEFYEGRTLDGMIREKGMPLTAEELLPLARPVLGAFSEVHEQSVLHRDVKPSNIYVRKNGEPIILDFGAARQTLENTRKLTSILTPGYAPLEQYDTDGNQGPWTDVYGCAATFYFALTGKQPTEALRRLQGTAMPSPRDLVSTVDPAVDRAILRGMAMEIADRTPSAEAFLAELEGGEPVVIADAAPRDDHTVVHGGVMSSGSAPALAAEAAPAAPASSATPEGGVTPEAPAVVPESAAAGRTADLRSEPDPGTVVVGGRAPGTVVASGEVPGTAIVPQGESGTAVVEAAPPKRPSRKAALGAAALILVSVPVGAILWMKGGEEVAPPPAATGADVGVGAAGEGAGPPTEQGAPGQAVAAGDEAAGDDAARDEAPGQAASRDPSPGSAAGAAVGETRPPPSIPVAPSRTPATGPTSTRAQPQRGAVAGATGDAAAGAFDEPAAAQPGTGLVVLILGEGREVRSAETEILGGMLRVGQFEALDAEGLQVLRADPAALRAALGGDFARLADAGASAGAEFVAVGDLQARAAPTVGAFYGGSAELEIRLYRISTRRLINTATFQVGGAGTPQKMGNTEADARRQAIEAVAAEAVAAIQRWMRLALR